MTGKLTTALSLALQLTASLLCASCELLLRFDDPQCSSDADCSDRGLFEASCVRGLCQQRQPQREIAGSELLASRVAITAAQEEQPDAGQHQYISVAFISPLPR